MPAALLKNKGMIKNYSSLCKFSTITAMQSLSILTNLEPEIEANLFCRCRREIQWATCVNYQLLLRYGMRHSGWVPDIRPQAT